MLLGVVAALASRNSSNCDDLFDLGLRANGVYGILVGEKIVQTFCEFDRDGYNWMVRWQGNIFKIQRSCFICKVIIKHVKRLNYPHASGVLNLFCLV